MKILILDPSRFTPFYNQELALGIIEAATADHININIIGRRQRTGERSLIYQDKIKELSFYYSFSESFFKSKKSFGFKLIKGLEHILNSIQFYFYCLNEKPDIIHVQWVCVPMVDYCLLKLLKKKFKLVFTIHDNEMFLGAKTSWLQIVGYSQIPKLFDNIIVHTPKSYKIWCDRGLSPNKIHIIPFGPIRFEGEQSFQGDSNDNIIMKAPPYVILLFGAIKHYKGYDIIIESFSRISSEDRKDWILKIVGYPFQSTTDLKQLAKDKALDSQIVWDERYVPDIEVPQIARSATLFAFPYRNIDASGVLMGFLKYNKPIVASRLGAFDDLLSDQLGAFLCSPEDVADLTSSLKKAMEFALAEKNFQWNQNLIPPWKEVGQKTLAVYVN